MGTPGGRGDASELVKAIVRGPQATHILTQGSAGVGAPSTTTVREEEAASSDWQSKDGELPRGAGTGRFPSSGSAAPFSHAGGCSPVAGYWADSQAPGSALGGQTSTLKARARLGWFDPKVHGLRSAGAAEQMLWAPGCV